MVVAVRFSTGGRRRADHRPRITEADIGSRPSTCPCVRSISDAPWSVDDIRTDTISSMSRSFERLRLLRAALYSLSPSPLQFGGNLRASFQSFTHFILSAGMRAESSGRRTES